MSNNPHGHADHACDESCSQFVFAPIRPVVKRINSVLPGGNRKERRRDAKITRRLDSMVKKAVKEFKKHGNS